MIAKRVRTPSTAEREREREMIAKRVRTPSTAERERERER